MSSKERKKQKKKMRLIIPLGCAAIVLLTLIGVIVIQFVEKQKEVIQQGNTAQGTGPDAGQNVGTKVEDLFLEIFKEEKPAEKEWIVEGEPVSKELLYGYYLPRHCSDTEIANVDVVLNMFEEKEWSTYLSSTGKKLTLSAVPLLWNGSKVDIGLISYENLEALEEKTGYLHGLAGIRSYENMIRELYPEYGFTTVTYYDDRCNLYTVDCAYVVDGNDMTLLMIHYDKGNREYSLIPMENYQVIREDNEITIYKDKNFVTYVPYNLCESASTFCIDAFVEDKSDRYEDIIGITYYNANSKEEEKSLYGCLYFVDGSKASQAEFDFSKENQVTIRWKNKETDYFGSVVEIEGSGEVTFSYKIVQDTGLILEKDGIEYSYLQKMDE